MILPLKLLPKLEKNVLVWIRNFSVARSQLRLLRSYLSPSEIDRAQKYKTKKLQTTFIIARGFLRKILGAYLKLPPNEVEFLYNAFGKPYLHYHHLSSIHFNLSHSHNRFAIALTNNRKVGIDIEYHNSHIISPELVQAVFSSSEIMAYRALPNSLKIIKFFQGWTLKEAYVKAIGFGLNFDVRNINIPLNKHLRNFSFDRCKLFILPMGDKWAGALAVEKSVSQIIICNQSIK
jgi:4'-phosphopantetheinyl transferase